MTSTKPKIGFYPCCSSDILEPLAMVEDYVDEMIFCDIRDTPVKKVNSNKHKKPIPTFLKGDIRETISTVKLIDLLFYRRDTGGEGGSGVWVLGDSFLPRILARFNPKGGLIITDGSNNRGGIFKKMKSASGLTKFGWHIEKTEDQPFKEKFGLFKFKVSPLI